MFQPFYCQPALGAAKIATIVSALLFTFRRSLFKFMKIHELYYIIIFYYITFYYIFDVFILQILFGTVISRSMKNRRHFELLQFINAVITIFITKNVQYIRVIIT